MVANVTFSSDGTQGQTLTQQEILQESGLADALAERQESSNGFRFYEVPPEENSAEEEATEENPLKTDGLLSSQNFKYPQDVGENPEQPHSIIFYINARERSSVGSEALNLINADKAAGGFGAWAQAQDAKTEQTAGENRASADEVDFLKGIFQLATAFASGKAAGALTKSVTGNQALGNSAQVAGTFVGFDVGKNLAPNILQANDTVRLLNTIQLHIPAPPNVSYGAKWNNSSVGAVGGGILNGNIKMPEVSVEGAQDLMNTMGEMLQGNNNTANATIRAAIQSAANLPSQLGGTDLGDVFDIATKTTLNPFREQLFEQMDFRSFGFNYTFAPKNEAELMSVLQIIHLFKYHMHPELKQGKTVMIYPSEFNIEYMYKDSRNQYVNQISSCALTNMDVTYGGADFTTFKSKPGAPTQINMALKFVELEMLVRSEKGITNNWSKSK